MVYNPSCNFLISDSRIAQMANGDIDDSVLDYASENDLGLELYVTQTDFDDQEKRNRMYWIAEYLQKKDVDVRGVHAPTSETLDNMTSSEEEMTRYIEGISKFVSPEYVTVHTHLYPDREGNQREEAQEDLIDRMAGVVDSVEDSTDFDGRILMENSSFAIYGNNEYDVNEDQRGFPLLETPEDMRKFSEYIQNQNYGDRVGMVLDTNHSDDPNEAMRNGGNQIGNIHLHDGINVGEEEWRRLADQYFPDGQIDREGIPEGDGKSIGHIPPYKGERLPENFLEVLNEVGFVGNLTLEVEDDLLTEEVVAEFNEEWT